MNLRLTTKKLQFYNGQKTWIDTSSKKDKLMTNMHMKRCSTSPVTGVHSTPVRLAETIKWPHPVPKRVESPNSPSALARTHTGTSHFFGKQFGSVFVYPCILDISIGHSTPKITQERWKWMFRHNGHSSFILNENWEQLSILIPANETNCITTTMFSNKNKLAIDTCKTRPLSNALC